VLIELKEQVIPEKRWLSCHLSFQCLLPCNFEYHRS